MYNLQVGVDSGGMSFDLPPLYPTLLAFSDFHFYTALLSHSSPSPYLLQLLPLYHLLSPFSISSAVYPLISLASLHLSPPPSSPSPPLPSHSISLIYNEVVVVSTQEEMNQFIFILSCCLVLSLIYRAVIISCCTCRVAIDTTAH